MNHSNAVLVRVALGRVAIVSMLVGSSWGIAANPSDFYCSEILQAQPAFYDVAIKNCGDGKPSSTEGVCTLTVFCAYVTDEIKSGAKAKLGKEFSGLSEDEKRAYVKESDSIEWLPTILSCKGSKASGVAICPAPEQCKGDLYYKLQPAMISPEDFKGLQQRQVRGNTRTFQAGEQPSASGGIAQ